MAGMLTAPDLYYYSEMREHEVLEAVDGHQLELGKGIVSVVCLDPFRRGDIYRHKEGLLAHHCPDKLIAPVSWPGGALRLCPEVNTHGSSLHRDMLDAIKVGMRALNTTTVVLYLHVPCLFATGAGISLIAGLDLLFTAKGYVKRKIQNAKVACFVHIDRGNRQMNTYFIGRNRYVTWRHNLPTDQSA